MNKQGEHGIEWTDYTWNVVGGCQHACRWQMPDGSTAICYAEAVANGVARQSYPQGFGAHYWHPDKLKEPLEVKKPAKIFLDSMSDLMGHWVPDEQINAVLSSCLSAHWHTFQLLTKNAPRLEKFVFPRNVWVGASVPPTFYMGKRLSQEQQERMFRRTWQVLSGLDVAVRWMSIEPLSWNVADMFYDAPLSRRPLDWIVIGAASNGKKLYQPAKVWVEELLDYCDFQGIPVFFKGNLDWPKGQWRANFPTTEKQLRMF